MNFQLWWALLARVKVAQNTALEVAIFRYLTFVFFSQGETLTLLRRYRFEDRERALAVKKYF